MDVLPRSDVPFVLLDEEASGDLGKRASLDLPLLTDGSGEVFSFSLSLDKSCLRSTTCLWLSGN